MWQSLPMTKLLYLQRSNLNTVLISASASNAERSEFTMLPIIDQMPLFQVIMKMAYKTN